MRIKQQFSSKRLETPLDHQNRKISELIYDGLITDMNEKGFYFFTPLGSIILDNIEKILIKQARRVEFDRVCLPSVMSTTLLEQGQTIGDQFSDKIMHLTGSLKDYHVISSPEMLFVKWGSKNQLSHNQLPIKHFYLDNLHRQKNNPKGTLFPQQIRIWGG